MGHFSEKGEVQRVLFHREWTDTGNIDHLKKLKLYKKRKEFFIFSYRQLSIIQWPEKQFLDSAALWLFTTSFIAQLVITCY